jgi:excinuclease UvrABC nuclease subunit
MPIGAQHQSFQWSEASILQNAPVASGAYAIFKSGQWIYVGESNNIQRRLLEHFRGDNACITRLVPAGFQFEVCNEAERMLRQALLIRQLNPACNQLAS